MNDLTTNLFFATLRRCFSPKSADLRQLGGSRGTAFGRGLVHGAAFIGCGPLVIAVAIAWVGCLDSTPWVRMVWLSLSIYGGLKWLTWYQAVRHGQVRSTARSIGYLIAWPGMDAARFFDDRYRPARPTLGEWCFAASKTIVGVAIARNGWLWLPASSPVFAGWVGLGGLVLTLHFGLFHLLALVWQRIGVDAKPIMEWPLLARSPSDFWNRRWNRAFHDIADGIAFRPLARRLGGWQAIMAIFAASGLIHDFVISIPAHGGYGLPTIYFLIQGAAVCIERSKIARRLGLTHGVRGRWFAATVVLLPLGLLFHPPFIVRVVLPLLHVLGCG